MRARRRIAKGEVACSYVLTLNGVSLNGDPALAESVGHVGQFVNDARGVLRVDGRDNNVALRTTWFRVLDRDGRLLRMPCVLLLALRCIRANEEILVDYGEGYWSAWRRQELPRVLQQVGEMLGNERHVGK